MLWSVRFRRQPWFSLPVLGFHDTEMQIADVYMPYSDRSTPNTNTNTLAPLSFTGISLTFLRGPWPFKESLLTEQIISHNWTAILEYLELFSEDLEIRYNATNRTSFHYHPLQRFCGNVLDVSWSPCIQRWSRIAPNSPQDLHDCEPKRRTILHRRDSESNNCLGRRCRNSMKDMSRMPWNYYKN